MRQDTILIMLSAALCTLLVGCSSSVQVSQVGPEERSLGSEILDMRNCDSNDAMITTLASEAPVRQQITLSGEAFSNKTGEAIDLPADEKTKLISQIESAYQQEYERALEHAGQVEFTIPGHKIHMYAIKWTQRIFRSTVFISMEGQACTASYTYALEIPELDSYTVMACTA